jgi:hypothetical protein
MFCESELPDGPMPGITMALPATDYMSEKGKFYSHNKDLFCRKTRIVTKFLMNISRIIRIL